MTAKAMALALLILCLGCGRKAEDIEKGKGVGADHSIQSGDDSSASAKALFYAIDANDTILVREAIKGGAQLDVILPNGETPLTFALKKGKPSLVEAILNASCDPDMPNDKGQRPVHIAINDKNKSAVFFLLAKGANLNVKNQQGLTPLLQALELEDRATALELLIAGAKLGKTADKACDLALRLNYEDVCSLIRKIRRTGAKAGVDQLQDSVLAADEHFLEYLFRQSKLLEASKGAKLLTTALAIEDSGKRMKMLKYLLRRGFNPNGETGDGLAPLFLAVEKDLFMSANILLVYGADPNTLDENFSSPLLIAVENLSYNMVKMLASFNAKRTYEYERDGIRYVKDACSNLPDGGWWVFDRLSDEQKYQKSRIKLLLGCL